MDKALTVFSERSFSHDPYSMADVWAFILWLDRLPYFVLTLGKMGLLLFADFFIHYCGELALSGVAAYEWSPLYFWCCWVPSMLVFLVNMELRILRWGLWIAKWTWLLVLRRFALGWLLEVFAAWLLRGRKAPPAVLRAEQVRFIGGVPAPQANAPGMAYAQAVQVPFASVAAGGLTPARIRRRARWVCSLQDYLEQRPGVIGSLVKGRWVPDLPDSTRPITANAVLALLDGGSKLLGGGVLPSDDPKVNEPFLIVQRDSGREIVVPNLLGRLSRGTFGRERDAALLAQLRSRAVEWCSDKKVVSAVVPLLVPGHVALALQETAPERLAREFLEAVDFPLTPSR